jgi:hypothetical protein
MFFCGTILFFCGTIGKWLLLLRFFVEQGGFGGALFYYGTIGGRVNVVRVGICGRYVLKKYFMEQKTEQMKFL